MMSFFKKEHKEDRERRKLEKKSLKDTSLILANSSGLNNTTHTTNDDLISNDYPYSNNNNNNKISEDLIIINHSNSNSSSSPIVNTKNTKMMNMSSSSSSTSSSSSSTLKSHSQIIATTSKSSIDSTTTTTTTTSTTTTQPSIISTNNTSSSTPQVLPKPRKGILKTMSKFGIGPTLTTITTLQPTPPPPVKPLTQSSSTPATNTKIEPSKRTSSQLNQKSNQLVNQTNCANFLLPSLRSIPLYLSDIKQTKFDNSSLLRTLHVPSSLVSKLELIQLDEDDDSDEDYSSFIFIACSSSDSVDILPGDQLIQFNNQLVLGKSLNEIKSLLDEAILASSSSVQLQVRTSLKCSELFTRNQCDNFFKEENALNSDSLSSISSSSQEESADLDSVWLVHTNGYSLVRIVSKVNDNDDSDSGQLCTKFRVKLENGNLIEVNEENLEKINPVQFDYCEDLSKLRFINESSLIHALRQRYHTLKLIHTNVGSNTMLILKPPSISNSISAASQLELVSSSPLSVYNDRVMAKFKGRKMDDMSPHIYSYTQNVYRTMLATRQDQSIILAGHSGSAKTYNSKLVLNYLFKVASPTIKQNSFTEMKLNALYCLLNAFCCVSTDKNVFGASRFLNIFLLEFNHSGQLASILLQLIQLDYTRLIYQPNNESNYLIFYYLLNGADTHLKSELQLNHISLGKNAANLLFHSDLNPKLNNNNNNNNTCKLLFQNVLDSFKHLNFTESEIKSLMSILAAIIHLSRAEATRSQQSTTTRSGQFLNPNEAHKAATLLGLSFQQLTDAVFTLSLTHHSQGSTKPNGHLSNSSSARISPDPNANLHLDPVECLQGYCLGLYQECLNMLVNFINRSFRTHSLSQQPISNSIQLIDPPGFQYHPMSALNTKTNPASYSDLMCNYLSERLQLMFYQINFINPIEKCAQEGLDIDLVEHIPESPSALVNWFEKTSLKSQQQQQQQQLNQNGLLSLIEEHQTNETSSKEFLQKLFESDQRKNFVSFNSDSNFTIHHQFGLFPVEYNLTTWLDVYCKDYATHRNALTSLNESKKDFVSSSIKQSLTLSNAAATFNSVNLNSLNTLITNDLANQASSLKRQASVRKMLNMSKRKSFRVNFKLQVDSIFDSMRRTRANFVFCVLPVQSHQWHQPQQSLVLAEKLDVPLLRSQLKAHQLLAACRIYRQGYPEHLSFDEFERRFSMFIAHNDSFNTSSGNTFNDEHKQACLSLIKLFDIDQAFYKLGTTQIFFKAGILNKLNDKRDERLNDLIVKLQANCRRYLAQKQAEKRRIQDSAIKCIQKNIRISFALKKWKWWRLYTQLMPIINVQNSENLLKQCKEELDELKRKNERLANEKSDLKLLNNQLETKLMNLQVEFAEERATNAGAIDLLEVETSERMRLERELKELRPAYNESVKKLETLETEMLELKLYTTKKSIEHELEKDDIDGLSTQFPSQHQHHSTQFEKLKRDYELLKQKQDKEQLERSLIDMKLKEKDHEIDELEKQLTTHKRKYQKLSEDTQDMQRLCDENSVRNRELEKIQAKFDAEMAVLRGKLDKEKELREKSERERDASKYEIFAMKNDLDTQRLESTYLAEKCERLERDLKEYESMSVTNGSPSANLPNSANASHSSEQFLKLKSQIREMEAKLKDQEEELDDQQGTIQQLEQVKLRLEMQSEKEKQKFQRELAEKDSEMDDLRFHTQKKIKAIEMQLEEESDLAQMLQREKRELERKMREITVNTANGKKGANAYVVSGSSASSSNEVYEYVNKLKRQMLKYKTLANDAQTQLEKLRENLPKQSIIRALKLQLEDSEISKANALKTKQLLQVEISDLQQQIDDLNFAKQNLEEQNIHLNREVNNLKSQLEEQERDADDNLKKYQNHIQNYSLDTHRFIDLNNQIDLLSIENRLLKEKIRELEEKVSYYENAYVDKSVLNKLESKLRDLECRLDLESSHKSRLQTQLERVKQQYEKSLNELETVSSREKKCEDMLKKSQRQYKETLEEFGDIRKKLIDLEETKKRIEQQNEILERELETSKSEIKINQNRLDAFQNAFNAMNNDDEDENDDDDDESEEPSYDEDDDYDEVYDSEEQNYVNGNADNRLNLSVNGSTVNGKNTK